MAAVRSVDGAMGWNKTKRADPEVGPIGKGEV